MNNVKELFNFKHIAMIAAGNLLVAFATVFFILPRDILSGGVTTVSIILSTFIPLSRVVLIAIVNISLFVVGAICLGKKFALSSLLSTFIYPFFVSVLSLLDTTPFSHIDPILSALYAGLLVGCGLGLVFRVNASTGGMDIPALIMHKYLSMPTNQCVMLVDTVTILCGLWIFGLNTILVGLVAVMASSFAIHWVSTFGGESAQNIMIISDKWPEIQQCLLHQFERGVTVLEGQGAWSNEPRPVLMCCINTREYGGILNAISAIDPHAFVIANTVHEVRGEGFTYAAHTAAVLDEKTKSKTKSPLPWHRKESAASPASNGEEK